MNSTKITSCFVGNPLWPIMNLMNIKRGEGREGGGGGSKGQRRIHFNHAVLLLLDDL